MRRADAGEIRGIGKASAGLGRHAGWRTDAPQRWAGLPALLQTVIARLMTMLTRRGVLVDAMGQTCRTEPDADGEEVRTLRPLQAATVTLQAGPGR